MIQNHGCCRSRSLYASRARLKHDREQSIITISRSNATNEHRASFIPQLRFFPGLTGGMLPASDSMESSDKGPVSALLPAVSDILSSSDGDDIPQKELFPESPTRPILGVAGGGVFFFWEVGVLKYLQEKFWVQEMNLIGVSAGALASVLVACQVDLDRAVRRAYDISVEQDLFNRPGGLQGIWGKILREWLEDLLPENAHEICTDRVKIIATRMPRMRLEYLEEFESREALIDSLMASVHIPFFLDGNGVYKYKGQQYIDGSIWDFFYGNNSSLLTIGGRSEIIDYFFDDQLEFSRLDFVKLLTLDTVNDLIQSGYSYAERTDAKGLYDEKLGQCRKGYVRQAVEGVPRRLWGMLT
jgi:hypothetical protein